MKETIYQESGMFKIKSELLFNEPQIQNIIKESNARIVTVNKEFFVLEKSGKRNEIEAAAQGFKYFRNYAICAFWKNISDKKNQ